MEMRKKFCFAMSCDVNYHCNILCRVLKKKINNNAHLSQPYIYCTCDPVILSEERIEVSVWILKCQRTRKLICKTLEKAGNCSDIQFT